MAAETAWVSMQVAFMVRAFRRCGLETKVVRFEGFTFRSVRRLLVTANVVFSSPILVTLMMDALSSSETSVLTRATRRNIPEDVILQKQKFFISKFNLGPILQLPNCYCCRWDRRREIDTERKFEKCIKNLSM
jgi:hypothetical protein